jgi:AcrR family transcriptional regulator
MQIKHKIINTTIKIIQEEHDFSDITIRKIAKKAGIGVGLINYHFQTKENLINIAVRTFINEIICGWNDATLTPKSDSKVELLCNMFQVCSDFLAAHPKISRISILNDFTNPNLKDNTMDTLNGVP